ncbi:MAG TPA: hypothetical protein VM621_02880 [Luteibacter sp.]|uniref:hypothetical protein n=1 Tax=Luteibacter sp. TaxID=1886636 RepID=UPI002C37E056|nr:hypothetical protein [Luteibacter sp.]HVI53981.1 hypothetical protein [Luteibacter sp.]
MRNVIARHAIAVTVLSIAGLLWTLFVNGAVPFIATPTLGQAASMMGYAQAFANQHWYSVYGHAFGYPVPAALATGLPLAWAAAWPIRFGTGAADAYSLAVALWLTVGYAGAYRLTRMLGARECIAVLSATVWMSLPMVWAHQGYSSLGLGLGMLPLYVSSSLAILDAGALPLLARSRRVAWFIALCTVAIFMDGYSFMMFVTAASVLFVFRTMTNDGSRARLVGFAAPVYAAGFIAAFLVYTRYVGRTGFEPSPLDFFRGWSLDLAFAAMPTSGEFWLWDLLGWARARSEALYFGDASVWTTTFALPLAAAGLYCMISMRARPPRTWAMLAIALFGLYMALGPTIKIDSVKPDGMAGPLMSAHQGLMPTGSAILSEHVPGLKSMRAPYRWEALFLLGMWGLVAMKAASSTCPRAWQWGALYLLLIAMGAPHPLALWGDYKAFHRDFSTIDRDVVLPLAARVAPGSRVFFVPYTNDVMANYLSPKLRVVSYNIGGDKQIEIARGAWPTGLRQFDMNRFDATDVPRIRSALLEGDVDVVIVPYFNSLWAAHMWPCVAEARGFSKFTLDIYRRADFLCPDQIRAKDAATVAALSGDEFLDVDSQPLFALITLKRKYSDAAGRERARLRILSDVTFPIDIVRDEKAAGLVLGEGWYPPEPFNRWSQAKSVLTLPVPPSCVENGCKAVFRFAAFSASAPRPVTVLLSMANRPAVASSATMVDEGEHELALVIPKGERVVTVNVAVPAATSPSALGVSVDARVLGISLKRIDFQP